MISDDKLEEAYYKFDAIRKGLPPYGGFQESGNERLAFKSILKEFIKTNTEEN